MSDAKVKTSEAFERALLRLVRAASMFALKAQDLSHEQQPQYAAVFNKALLAPGGHLGVRVEIGDRPLVECAVVVGDNWYPFLRWPATQSAEAITTPTSNLLN